MFIYQSLANHTKTAIIPKQMPIVKEELLKPVSKKNEKETDSPIAIMVDVQGSVKSPGVYKMQNGERVIDVIRKAGGLLDEAEARSVNQAQKITDEMIIYVAAKGEEIEPLVAKTEKEIGEKLNINSADLTELQQLSGVGPSKAQSIIYYREENGPFTSIEQLLEVRGIGEKTIEEWKDKIKFQ
jgi:competence protein ComEA